jgi:hypothetical protein
MQSEQGISVSFAIDVVSHGRERARRTRTLKMQGRRAPRDIKAANIPDHAGQSVKLTDFASRAIEHHRT